MITQLLKRRLQVNVWLTSIVLRHILLFVETGRIRETRKYINYNVNSRFMCIHQRHHALLNLSSEITCPMIPYWEGSVLSSQATAYGSRVNVTCASSYSFETGDDDVVMTSCTAAGTWSPSVPNCVGKLRERLSHMLFMPYSIALCIAIT